MEEKKQIPEWLKGAADRWMKQNESSVPDIQSECMLYESFIAGVMSPEAAKFHDQMRWVKSIDELPTGRKAGKYDKAYGEIRVENGYISFYNADTAIHLTHKSPDLKNLFWLLEPPVE